MAWTVTLIVCYAHFFRGKWKTKSPRSPEEEPICSTAFLRSSPRMRYIGRWGLMRNTFEENIQEHSHMVAVLAHGLAVIQRDILGQPADPDRCASAALFHDASEIPDRRSAHADQVL